MVVESEMRELEKEMKVEKDKEEAIERKIREGNRGRLITKTKNGDRKRRKIDDEQFISIRKI